MYEYLHAQVLAERLLRRCIHVARDRSHARWFRDDGRCRWTALDLRSPLTSNGAGSSISALKAGEVGLDRPATDHDSQSSIQFEGAIWRFAALQIETFDMYIVLCIVLADSALRS